MSQIYFTSSYISSKRALSLEELAQSIDLNEIVLVFDTNLVVDYRDFFLSAQKFKNKKWDVYQTLRYMIEQVHRYGIATNMILGIDESTRRVSDFSRIDEKFDQTSQAINGLIHSSVDDIDNLLRINKEISPVIDNSKKTLSKIKALGQNFIGSHLLTVSYITSLKIVELKLLQEQEVISRHEAYKQFLHFTMKEIDFVSIAMVNYALHVFGGADSLRRILFKPGMKSSSKEDVIHQIFNGSIDLIFPTLVNHTKLITPELSKLTPVFATRDERLAELHSLNNTKLIINNNKRGFNFELVEAVFSTKQNLCWTQWQLKEYIEIYQKDAISRLKKSIPELGQKTDHLLPKVIDLEQEVLKLI